MISNNSYRALFVFDHGLGDFINFLPVYHEFQRQVGKRVILGSPDKRQFNLIDKNVISLSNFNNIRSGFDYIYKIHYPDSVNSTPPIEWHTEAAKPYLCAYYELGMEPFTWAPLVLENKEEPIDNRVGVHLFGHTGMHRKACSLELVEMIWNELLEEGYEPFEIHMIPNFASEYSNFDRGDDALDIIHSGNSLRFEKPDLARMIEETSKCKFFIGIDSGPIYLASALIGSDNIIGLVNLNRHDHFFPKHISTINVNTYKKDTIKRILYQKIKYNAALHERQSSTAVICN